MKKDNNPKIKVTKNGPYLVSGKVPLQKHSIIPDKDGVPEKWQEGEKYPEQKEYALCRCGQSKNKPYCDGTHARVKFNGAETASRKKYLEQSKKISGPDLDLTDVQELCAAAGFCHRAGGTWKLTENSNDSTSKKIAIQEACNCPSGRLVAWDKKTGKPIEPIIEQSISLVECPADKISGPIWVRGRISIESDNGSKYEVRNRMTLCRCGKSKNKPFCDGTHISIGFNDGDESIHK